MAIKREDLHEISKLDDKLKVLEAQYRTLSNYDETFVFNIDYLEKPVQQVGKPGKGHFTLEFSARSSGYASLKNALKSSIAQDIKHIALTLGGLGVDVNVTELLDEASRPIPAKK